MFEKNLEILSRGEAEKIRGTKAAVIGLGALGQLAAEMLARSGFEYLVLCDGDRVEQSNLNRQLYGDIMTIGMSKAEVVCARLSDISPRMKLNVCDCFLNRENAEAILKGTDLILDCVDSIPVKLYLEEKAEEIKIPLIHGAVEGWFAQVSTVFPGDGTLSVVYEKRREQKITALMPAAALAASLQASEALKLAMGEEPSFRGRLLCADLKSGEFDSVTIRKQHRDF